MFGSVPSNQIDLDGGKMLKLVRKLHNKTIKINSEWEEEKQTFLVIYLKANDFLLIWIRKESKPSLMVFI